MRFSIWLSSLSYQIYRHIDAQASCGYFNTETYQTQSSFSVPEFLYYDFFLIWLISPPLPSVPLEVYFITGGKQFHPLAPPHSPFDCGESMCRGATSFIFPSAGCKSTHSKASLQSVEKGRSWVLGKLLHKERNHRNLQVLSGSREGDGGVKDLSNRGKPLRIFKVIACGREVVACICNYHVHLSIDEELVMVTLDAFS